MFFHLGCHGPLVHGPCNKLLWSKRSSKTRVGVPCFGCTRPDFPQRYPFFETRNIEGIPIELPEGISRAHYMAYKGMAAAAAPRKADNPQNGHLTTQNRRKLDGIYPQLRTRQVKRYPA